MTGLTYDKIMEVTDDFINSECKDDTVYISVDNEQRFDLWLDYSWHSRLRRKLFGLSKVETIYLIKLYTED